TTPCHTLPLHDALPILIVEPTISIRRMYQPPYMAPNYANMIFASNKPAPVEVAPDDRRFNVGPYQDQPIQLTATEVDDLIPKERSEEHTSELQSREKLV